MGIRFLCPNGHKLNVKSFLAGKKGVCPHCGVRLIIPTESDPQVARKKKRGESGNGSPTGPVPAASQPTSTAPARSVGSIDFSRPAAPQLAAAAPATAAPVGKAVAPVVAAAATSPINPLAHAAVATPPAATPASASKSNDPIAESPNAVWYVRPPTGNQYGPARGDIMRKWIAEGRVSADSLVWREGWTDWQTAGQVLPSMAASASAAPAVVSPAAFGAAAPAITEVRVSDAATNSLSSRPRSKVRTRPSTSLAIGIVVTLALLAVGLLVALVMVIQNTSK